jgi:hypothetical protein
MNQDDRDKLLATALIEEFKARWQELLNFEGENNRWSTIYVTAIIAVVGWFVNSDRGEDLGALVRRGSNGYLLLFLAFVNNLYTLSMAMKGYQIQQLGLYLYTEVRPKLNKLTGGDTGTWERWRREQFPRHSQRGEPERLRAVYFVLVGALPLFVSGIVLSLYAIHCLRAPWLTPANWPFYSSCAVIVVATAAALSTARINSRWKDVLSGETSAKEDHRGKRRGHQHNTA